MASNTGYAPDMCPTVQRAFDLLGRKWAGLIVHALDGGELRFSDLERAVPNLSSRMLSARMHELEADGLVERIVYAGKPVRVAYRLTAKGLDLRPIMRGIARWARKWQSPG
jgi:DNA-binding HxlR family transcriptional regulator